MSKTTTPARHGPLGLAIAKVMSALRGDKYMVDAYQEPDDADPTELAAAGDRPG
jgi:hypothetical protein